MIVLLAASTEEGRAYARQMFPTEPNDGRGQIRIATCPEHVRGLNAGVVYIAVGQFPTAIQEELSMEARFQARRDKRRIVQGPRR